MDFFPVHVEQFEEDVLFKKLSPVKKCYYYLLQSEFNKRGEFYFRDADFAAALDVSIETIRKYRREFVKNGWIEIQAGGRDRYGRGLATTYKSVKWAHIDKGHQFVRVNRIDMDMLLSNIGRRFTHDTIVVWVALKYWRMVNTVDDVFFIAKSKLVDLTGIKSLTKIDNAFVCLNSFVFSGGSHLLEYEDRYHRYEIKHLLGWASPSESPDNYGVQSSFWKRVEEKGNDIQFELNEKDKVRRRKKGEVFLEDLYRYFEEKYQEKYEKPLPSNYLSSQDELEAAAKQIGVKEMVKSINHYFAADHVESVTSHNAKTRTLANFLKLKYWMLAEKQEEPEEQDLPPVDAYEEVIPREEVEQQEVAEKQNVVPLFKSDKPLSLEEQIKLAREIEAKNK